MIDYSHIKKMAHSPLHNYIIPGLTSWLVGPAPTKEHGGVRLFTCSREHQEAIVPHSHRFDFQCVVLEGQVTNCIWTPTASEEHGDVFRVADLMYEGQPGKYASTFSSIRRYTSVPETYNQGDTYSMKHDEIHSIFFGRGAKVLFFEGPTVTHATKILEPYVDGFHIPTFEVRPWMFQAFTITQPSPFEE